MTNLVTGASGFVGSHVVRRLLARGESVRVLVRPSSVLRAIEKLPIERVYGDLRDAASLREAVRGVHRVFHVAADYRLWSADRRSIYESNVTGTRNILDAAHQAGVEKVVYTSSVATIAVHRPDLLPNEATQAGLAEMIGDYKRSKFLAEQEALKAAQAGAPVVVVNPTTPVGPADWKPTPTGKIILDFLRGKMPAYLDTGLNLVPVEDVAEGHLLAAERGKAGQRYILGGVNLTLKEILECLARITGRTAPKVQLPYAVAYAAGLVENSIARVLGREPQIPMDGVRMARHKMFVDASRAPRELGFVAASVEDALARAVRWYEENGYVATRAARGAVGVAA